MPNFNLAPTSRYYDIEVTILEGPGESRTPYLRRRFLPDPSQFVTVREHVVVDQQRLDHIAAAELGDPEAFWRLWDANPVLLLSDLVTPGRRLRITLPQGIAATTAL